MASAVIGNLRVDLGLNSAQFNAGAKKAQSTLGTLGASMKSFAVAATAALSFSAITTGFKSIVNHADELGKSAMKIGIPVEALSRLAYAAKLSNVEFGQLSTGLNKFNKNLAAIAGGGGGDAAKALSALGISAVDATGKLRPTQEVFLDIAEKFKGMEDGAGKSALAMLLLGKSGAELVPLLNEGRAGITKLMGETSLFGQVINEKFAKDADQFNDNLDRIAGAGQHLATALTEELLKSLVGVSDQMVAIVENGGMEAFLKGVRTEATTAAKEFNKLAEAWTFLTEGSEGFRKMVADAKAKTPLTQEQKNASASALNFGFASPIDTSGGGGETKKPAPIITNDAGKKLSEAFLQSSYDAKQLNLGILKLSETVPALGDVTQQLGEQFSTTFGDGLKGILGDAIDGTLNLKDSLTDLMKSLTKIALDATFKNLLSGGGAGTSSTGGMLAGLGKLFGFAGGGSFQVGGSGGIDSQLVAFKASPNERVDITKPGQDRGGGELNVVINDNVGAQVSARVQSKGFGQRELILMIDQRIESQVSNPYTKTSSALSARGARPQTKMR